MIKKNDLVKVIGTTSCGGSNTAECIPIGTICIVVDVDEDGVAIIPMNKQPYLGYGEYWYAEDALEKGRLEWVSENDNPQKDDNTHNQLTLSNFCKHALSNDLIGIVDNILRDEPKEIIPAYKLIENGGDLLSREVDRFTYGKVKNNNINRDVLYVTLKKQ